MQNVHKEILTKEHQLWNDFCKRLEGEEGCNMQITGDGLNLDDYQFRCDRTMERPYTKKILQKYNNIDVEGTMKYFEKQGGYCDCEILFNITGKDWFSLLNK